MISLAKHKKVRTEPAYVVYVGRSDVERYYGAHRCFTTLGNPYTLAAGGDRTDVIEKYRRWLWHAIKTDDSAVCNALADLLLLYEEHGKLVLVCHCAPELCHADVIARCLEWMIASGVIEQSW